MVVSLKQSKPSVLTCRLKDSGVALAVPGGKRLHHAVDLLGFTWQTEAPQELPAIRGGGLSRLMPRVRVHADSPSAHRRAWTKLRSANSCSSTKACSTLMLKSSLQEEKWCNEKRSEAIFPPSKQSPELWTFLWRVQPYSHWLLRSASGGGFDSWPVLVVSAPERGRVGANSGPTEGKHLKASLLSQSFVCLPEHFC